MLQWSSGKSDSAPPLLPVRVFHWMDCIWQLLNRQDAFSYSKQKLLGPHVIIFSANVSFPQHSNTKGCLFPLNAHRKLCVVLSRLLPDSFREEQQLYGALEGKQRDKFSKKVTLIHFIRAKTTSSVHHVTTISIIDSNILPSHQFRGGWMRN